MNNDGGPTFPSSNSPDTCYFAEGMTLRDYFAAKAMQGIVTSNLLPSNAAIARESFVLADAMMKAREA